MGHYQGLRIVEVGPDGAVQLVESLLVGQAQADDHFTAGNSPAESDPPNQLGKRYGYDP